jgi:hypothetical protein
MPLKAEYNKNNTYATRFSMHNSAAVISLFLSGAVQNNPTLLCAAAHNVKSICPPPSLSHSALFASLLRAALERDTRVPQRAAAEALTHFSPPPAIYHLKNGQLRNFGACST